MGLAEERAIYKFQQKQEQGYDPLTDWERLKDEGDKVRPHYIFQFNVIDNTNTDQRPILQQ